MSISLAQRTRMPEDQVVRQDKPTTTTENTSMTHELTELEELACIFSDVFKDANGFRPRFDTSDWTVETYREEIAKESRWSALQEFDEAYLDTNGVYPSRKLTDRMNTAELWQRSREMRFAMSEVPVSGFGWQFIPDAA